MTTQTPSVPGIQNDIGDTLSMKPVPVRTVMMALKCQLAQAYGEIEAIKKSHPNPDWAKSLKFKKGSAIFSGKTQVIQANGGKISVVIPFTGVDGTILTPNAGRTSSSTGTQESVHTFAIDPIAQNADICALCAAEKIEVGTFVKDAIVAAFVEALAMPLNPSGVAYDPAFTHTKLNVAASFKVVIRNEGGISSSILFTGAIDSTSPSVVKSQDRDGIYTIAVELPFQTGETQDPRKLIYERVINGSTVMIEEPYTQERYKDLIASGPEGAKYIIYAVGDDAQGRVVMVMEPFSERRVKQIVKSAEESESFMMNLQPQGEEQFAPEPDPAKR